MTMDDELYDTNIHLLSEGATVQPQEPISVTESSTSPESQFL